jgi:type IV pilus assembly protein PilY1
MSATRKPASRMMRRGVVYATLASFILTSSPGFAATTDIANAPIASGTTVQVLPNIMLIMDHSGSMASEYIDRKSVV